MEKLEVLVEPEDADLDIVFVHGLNPSGSEDHARRTWTHDESDLFWPDTLLRQDLPRARIILFAYNSSIRTNASNAPVHSHAKTLLNRLNLERQKDEEKHRRLIFVAHSLGGLLVKQALVEASIHSLTYGCIKAATKGLVFFATPHGGGNLAGLADVAANFTSAMTGTAKNSFLKTLKKNSLLNEVSTDHFRPQLADYQVLTFIETQMMDVSFKTSMIKLRIVPQLTSMYIVDSASAKLGAPHEEPLSLNRNHSEICKFSGREDHDYKLVGGNLQLMARKIQTKNVQCTKCSDENGAENLPQPLRHSQIPFASNIPGAPPSFIGSSGQEHPPINTVPLCKPFVGREEITREIVKSWQNWEGPMPRRVSLSGLGGVGKTQLSRYIIDQLGHWHFILWLNAGSKQSLQKDLEAAAIALRHELLRIESVHTQPNASQNSNFFYTSNARPEYLVELLKVWLGMAQARQANDPQVLVVLDDVDGLESSELFELSQMIIGDGIDVVFTTRNPTLADQTSYMDAVNFDVPPLKEYHAGDLLDELTKPNLKNRKGTPAAVTAATGASETEFLAKVAANMGYLPAALVSGSHYLMDNLASRNPHALSSYHAKWESPEYRWQILRFRRTSSRYPHTIHNSFEVSLQRLRRNTEGEGLALYFCCLNLLRLLSALNVERFARVELESLCDLLALFVQQETQDIARSREGEVELFVSLRRLSEDASKAPRCAAELLHVSLLTDPEGAGVLVLNSLIRACVMVRAHDDLAADKGLGNTGLSEVESLLLSRAARHICKSWEPCSKSFDDIEPTIP